MAKHLFVRDMSRFHELTKDPEVVQLIDELFRNGIDADDEHPAQDAPPAANPPTAADVTPPPLPSPPGDG